METLSYKSSILLCNTGDDDCVICQFLNGNRDIICLMGVIQHLDNMLYKAEERENRLMHQIKK